MFSILLCSHPAAYRSLSDASQATYSRWYRSMPSAKPHTQQRVTTPPPGFQRCGMPFAAGHRVHITHSKTAYFETRKHPHSKHLPPSTPTRLDRLAAPTFRLPPNPKNRNNFLQFLKVHLTSLYPDSSTPKPHLSPCVIDSIYPPHSLTLCDAAGDVLRRRYDSLPVRPTERRIERYSSHP